MSVVYVVADKVVVAPVKADASVSEMGMVGPDATVVGERTDPEATARLILADLTGVQEPGAEVVTAFAEQFVSDPEALVIISESTIDTWAGSFGLTLGKRER